MTPYARALCLVALASCHASDAKRPASTAASTAAPQPGLVHGADITLVAVAENGAAALTADQLGDVRMWPALDGSRPPIPIDVRAPSDLAIAPRPAGWLSAVVDTTGGLELLRFAGDGRLVGRARAPSEVEFVETVAFGDRMLARLADESLVALGDAGEVIGRITAGHGERIAALAARHGAVLAVIEARDVITALRWVEREPLRWGATLVPPEAIAEPIALAPNHERFAARTPDGSKLLVFAIGPGDVATRIPDEDDKGVLGPDITALGFVTDDRIGLLGPTLWWVMSAQHRGRFDGAGIPFLREGVFVDGLVIGGNGPSLLVADANLHTHFVGYRDVPTMMTLTAGANLMGTADTEGRSLWLDDELHEVRSFDTSLTGGTNAHPIDDRHVVVSSNEVASYGSTDHTQRLELVDIDHPSERVVLGRFDNTYGERFDPDRGELLISGDDRTVARIHFDAALHVDHPQTLVASNAVVLLDPRRAEGLVALDPVNADGGLKLKFLTATGRLWNDITVPGTLLAHDLAGTAYLQDDGDPSLIVVVTRAKLVRRFHLPIAPDPKFPIGAVSHDGALVVISGSTQIVAVDPEGHERWRAPMWQTMQLVFTRDDRALIALTRSGLLRLDATTGAQRSTACGWRFGSYELPAGQSSFGERPVCPPSP